MKRIESIKNGEQDHHDILTQIITLSQKQNGINLEDLIDDFVAFYVAGMQSYWSNVKVIVFSYVCVCVCTFMASRMYFIIYKFQLVPVLKLLSLSRYLISLLSNMYTNETASQ